MIEIPLLPGAAELPRSRESRFFCRCATNDTDENYKNQLTCSGAQSDLTGKIGRVDMVNQLGRSRDMGLSLTFSCVLGVDRQGRFARYRK